MRYAAGAILFIAGAYSAWYWYEDPFVKRDATLRKLLTNCEGAPKLPGKQPGGRA